MDLPHELASWFQSKIPGSISRASRPAALAGQNNVWKLTSSTGEEHILRCGQPGRSSLSLSGIAIRRHLADAKISTPTSLFVSDDGEIHGFGICEIMSVVAGEDLEIAWPTLPKSQAMQVSIHAADAVMASAQHMTGHPEHPISGFGLCGWGGRQPAPSWWSWCAQWLDWVSAMGARNETIEPAQALKVRMAMWNARHLIGQITLAKAKTFIWDVAERNVMVQNGKWSGLVDQDAVMVGDPMVAPALARVALEQSGASWAQEYEQTWMASWSVNAQDIQRASIYKALYALQFAAKGSRVMPDGRIQPSVMDGLVEKMIDNMQRNHHG